jgi:hypothetical protein
MQTQNLFHAKVANKKTASQELLRPTSLSSFLKRVGLLLSFPAFLLIAYLVPFDRLPPACIFYRLTGYPCPSCGLTRAVTAIVHCNPKLAVKMNPFGFLVVGGFGLWWVIALYETISGRKTRLHQWAAKNAIYIALVCIGMLMVFGVLRILWLM